MKVLIGSLVTLLWAACVLGNSTPTNWILTYRSDPFTSIAVTWQTFSEEPAGNTVFIGETSGNAIPSAYDRQVEATVFRIPGIADRWVYRAEITGLHPDTDYYLLMGSASGVVSKEIRFRTLGAENRPLRFVTGGDMGIDFKARALMRLSAETNPDIAIVGGDIAYANGRLNSVDKWDTWLRYYSEEMVTPEGRTIPAILSIGNHEVNGGYGRPKEFAPFYFGFLGQNDERTYFSRRLSEEAVLFVLDSGHVASHASQVEWMREEMKRYEDLPFKAAVYHVPLYPSHRDYMGRYSDLGRQHWLPVFDEFGLTVAFENHDHTFKRSHHLHADEIAVERNGTLYLGDGCWGRTARPIDFEKRWYLQEAGSVEHFWLVDLLPEGPVYQAIDLHGDVFDVYPQSHPEAAKAHAVMNSKQHRYKPPREAIHIKGFPREGANWSGSRCEIILENPFEVAMRATITLEYPDRAIAAKELPQSIEIPAGESRTFLPEFLPANAATLDWDDVDFDVIVEFSWKDPETGKAILMADDFGVPVF